MTHIHHSEVVAWAKEYRGEKFHALLCDPPYHLYTEAPTWRVKLGTPRTEADKEARRQFNGTKKGGFMGKKWDGGDVAFNPETWAALAEHLYDGAFGMAFASSRGWHRLAAAIEDAGLLIHPSIFGWAFGSGFPKATRIDTQIQPRSEHKLTGETRHRNVKPYDDTNGWNANDTKGDFAFTEPTDPKARMWQGHRYGLQALKPALEPIIVFQKPYRGKPVDNITRTGAGALNIDGTRIGTPESKVPPVSRRYAAGQLAGGEGNLGGITHAVAHDGMGRWAANFVLQHHPACNGSCVDGCAVKALGEQSGVSKSPKTYTRGANGFNKDIYSNGMGEPQGKQSLNFGDSGTAARFFFNGDWAYEVQEQIDHADPVRYVAKASRKERDAGLDHLPLQQRNTMGEFAHPSEGRTANKASGAPMRNGHPTVKPIALARWLATLLLPPVEYAPRRLLVPFSGSGSEMIGALLAGWEEIEGVEMNAEYIEIATARLAAAQLPLLS